MHIAGAAFHRKGTQPFQYCAERLEAEQFLFRNDADIPFGTVGQHQKDRIAVCGVICAQHARPLRKIFTADKMEPVKGI